MLDKTLPSSDSWTTRNRPACSEHAHDHLGQISKVALIGLWWHGCLALLDDVAVFSSGLARQTRGGVGPSPM